jgi:hypothetical protein
MGALGWPARRRWRWLAHLAGAAVATAVFGAAVCVPSSLAMSPPNIYWANFGGNPTTASTIGEANLDGTGVNQSFITGANSPFGVAVSVPVLQLAPASPPAFAGTPRESLGAPLTLT